MNKRNVPTGQSLIVATLAVLILCGCSFSQPEARESESSSDRAVLGVCDVIGTMQDCAAVLTETYLEARQRFSLLTSPSAHQIEAMKKMEKASEYYSTECRSLRVRAGAEINIVNGCEDALKDIVAALDAMRD